MEVIVKQLMEEAKNPDIGQDNVLELTCTTKEIGYNYIGYGTGLAISIPKGYAGLLFPMDSINSRDLMTKDSIGVIPNNSDDEIKVKFSITESELPNTYQIGDKIARMIIIPVTNFNFKFLKMHEPNETMHFIRI